VLATFCPLAAAGAEAVEAEVAAALASLSVILAEVSGSGENCREKSCGLC
jgi:hypothetical protein